MKALAIVVMVAAVSLGQAARRGGNKGQFAVDLCEFTCDTGTPYARPLEGDADTCPVSGDTVGRQRGRRTAIPIPRKKGDRDRDRNESGEEGGRFASGEACVGVDSITKTICLTCVDGRDVLIDSVQFEISTPCVDDQPDKENARCGPL